MKGNLGGGARIEIVSPTEGAVVLPLTPFLEYLMYEEREGVRPIEVELRDPVYQNCQGNLLATTRLADREVYFRESQSVSNNRC